MADKTTAQQVTPIAFSAALSTLIVGLVRWVFPDIEGQIPGAEAALTTVFAGIYIRYFG